MVISILSILSLSIGLVTSSSSVDLQRSIQTVSSAAFDIRQLQQEINDKGQLPTTVDVQPIDNANGIAIQDQKSISSGVGGVDSLPSMLPSTESTSNPHSIDLGGLSLSTSKPTSTRSFVVPNANANANVDPTETLVSTQPVKDGFTQSSLPAAFSSSTESTFQPQTGLNLDLDSPIDSSKPESDSITSLFNQQQQQATNVKPSVVGNQFSSAPASSTLLTQQSSLNAKGNELPTSTLASFSSSPSIQQPQVNIVKGDQGLNQVSSNSPIDTSILTLSASNHFRPSTLSSPSSSKQSQVPTIEPVNVDSSTIDQAGLVASSTKGESEAQFAPVDVNTNQFDLNSVWSPSSLSPLNVDGNQVLNPLPSSSSSSNSFPSLSTVDVSPLGLISNSPSIPTSTQSPTITSPSSSLPNLQSLANVKSNSVSNGVESIVAPIVNSVAGPIGTPIVNGISNEVQQFIPTSTRQQIESIQAPQASPLTLNQPSIEGRH